MGAPEARAQFFIMNFINRRKCAPAKTRPAGPAPIYAYQIGENYARYSNVFITNLNLTGRLREFLRKDALQANREMDNWSILPATVINTSAIYAVGRLLDAYSLVR